MKINVQLLRQMIVARGFNNCILANMIGVSPMTISNVLTGKNFPSYYVLSGFRFSLNLDDDEFNDIFFPDFRKGTV